MPLKSVFLGHSDVTVYIEFIMLETRHSKLGPSIDNLAIVYLLLTRPPLDWRSLCYQTKLHQSGGGRASNNNGQVIN